MTRIAVCQGHETPVPLVATMHWRGKEWLCLECGNLYTFFGASSADAVPELQERYEALRVEWEPIAKALITKNAWYDGCEQCQPIGHAATMHHLHATPQQWQEHERALAWIDQRTGGALARG